MVWDLVWERIALILFSHWAWIVLCFASLLQLSGSCCLSVKQRWKPQVRQGQGPDPAPAALFYISAASLLRCWGSGPDGFLLPQIAMDRALQEGTGWI